MSSVPAPPSREVRPIGRLGNLVTIVLCLSCVCDALVLGTWAWHVLAFGIDETWPMTPSAGEIDWLNGVGGWMFATARVATVVAAILFVVWLWRARANAEAIAPVPHVRGKAWIVFGWVVPVVNLWFPYQIVQSIWRTSDPSRVAGGPTRVPTSPLVVVWWVAFLFFASTSVLALGAVAIPETSAETSGGGVLFVGGAAQWGFVAAALAAGVVHDISRTQDRVAATLTPSAQ